MVGVLAGAAGCGSDGAVAEDPDASAAPSEKPSAQVSTPPRTAELITLATPAEGAKVADTFEASGKANSPEANVPWEIQDSTGKAVLDGAATADGWMDKLYPWSTTVDVSGLEPGTYTFIARTDDTSDGEGKPAEEVGAKITVE
ncbi:immunoglobulin-like protein involved in spore germination [Nocardioides albertanoniae]|uniref:Immunoglobulin-like protein involved in spore germination n=2 Tax=Nocardioides albertanoniae TaxID=1175486 RepID=A0A543A5B1_9ACTN|nr:immunoglobulin-like protein involved in spore germination [Nocardioides albertanoniae]